MRREEGRHCVGQEESANGQTRLEIVEREDQSTSGSSFATKLGALLLL